MELAERPVASLANSASSAIGKSLAEIPGRYIHGTNSSTDLVLLGSGGGDLAPGPQPLAVLVDSTTIDLELFDGNIAHSCLYGSLRVVTVTHHEPVPLAIKEGRTLHDEVY